MRLRPPVPFSVFIRKIAAVIKDLEGVEVDKRYHGPSIIAVLIRISIEINDKALQGTFLGPQSVAYICEIDEHGRADLVE